MSVYVKTFLQATRSPDLATSSTLDMLSRTALDYSTPYGSATPFHDRPSLALEALQDAIALLTTALALPVSHFHQVTGSASELLLMLISCISDVSQVSTAQALILLADVNNLLLHGIALPPNVRQALEEFAMSLYLIIGDDAKAAREAQLMHTLQLALGKGGKGDSSADIVTLGLELNYFVSRQYAPCKLDRLCFTKGYKENK